MDESSSGEGEDNPTVDEIPGSKNLWEATTRPANSADVNT